MKLMRSRLPLALSPSAVAVATEMRWGRTQTPSTSIPAPFPALPQFLTGCQPLARYKGAFPLGAVPWQPCRSALPLEVALVQAENRVQGMKGDTHRPRGTLQIVPSPP